MTYNAAANRLRPDPAQYWAGSGATAIVAALIAVVGILISRWTLSIPIMAPAASGAWGNAHTAEYALLSAAVTIVAAGLLYLLIISTPQPNTFFTWIMGLATLAAVVYPFSTSAPTDQKIATGLVNLILGIAIISLLTMVAARAIRRVPPPPAYGDGDGYGPDPGYQPGPGYVPGQRGNRPTLPIDEPPGRESRR